MSKPCIDLTGKRFTRLTAIRLSPDEPRDGWERKWLCQCDCGNMKYAKRRGLLRGTCKSCGCLGKENLITADRIKGKFGKDHPGWRGGRSRTVHGYIYLCTGTGGRKLEHIYVMEQSMGRNLRPEETVHHKNGVRDDNRLENLELWAGRHARGQRVEDLVDYAVALLKDYKPELLCQTSA